MRKLEERRGHNTVQKVIGGYRGEGGGGYILSRAALKAKYCGGYLAFKTGFGKFERGGPQTQGKAR